MPSERESDLSALSAYEDDDADKEVESAYREIEKLKMNCGGVR
jgi:hypothetical protein